jgi:hypothetical protein
MPKKKKRSLKNILNVLILAFAVVVFWRGVWGVMDVLLFPNDYLLSSIASIVVGVVILYFTKHLVTNLA